MTHVLYISYDGILEPLGQSQVLAYLRGLASTYRITLLSFEKPADLRDGRWRGVAADLRRVGITWQWLRYHKRPTLPATAWDIARGIIAGVGQAEPIRLIHARGYVASAIGLRVARMIGARFVFDMRGFWPDEKVDAGHWRRGSLAYRLTKRWERRFFQDADAIVSLTQAGVDAFPELGYRIRPNVPIAVIPTCADLERFAPGLKDPGRLQALGLDGAPVLGCVGTLSGWYLRRQTLEFLATALARLPRARLLMVTREDHAALRAELAALGVGLDRVTLTQAPFAEMPELIRLMDAGVFFIKPCFSKRASAATKLAEFLGSGVPVVINAGIGDSGEQVRGHRAGIVLDALTPDAYDTAITVLERLLHEPGLRGRCRQLAQDRFSLSAGVAAYRNLYDRLLAPVGTISTTSTPRRAPAEPAVIT